jgi:hypothetical protein
MTRLSAVAAAHSKLHLSDADSNQLIRINMGRGRLNTAKIKEGGNDKKCLSNAAIVSADFVAFPKQSVWINNSQFPVSLEIGGCHLLLLLKLCRSCRAAAG